MSEFNFVKGDRVRFDYWKPEQYAEILWVGTVLFAYISQDGIEKCMSKLHDWLPWIDPEATKDEPEALWRIITRWPEGDTFKESDFLYTEEQIKEKSRHVGFIQKIGKPWYFIDGKLVQKDEQRG